MGEAQTLTLDQLQTIGGVSKLNDMLRTLFALGSRVTFTYSLAASTSADAYAKWGEVTGTSSIGLRMPASGSIVRHSCLMNISTATTGDVTAEVRVNDVNASLLELEFASSLGTGVTSKNTNTARTSISFSSGDIVQIFLNETGTMVWDSVIGFIEVIFDET